MDRSGHLEDGPLSSLQTPQASRQVRLYLVSVCLPMVVLALPGPLTLSGSPSNTMPFGTFPWMLWPEGGHTLQLNLRPCLLVLSNSLDIRLPHSFPQIFLSPFVPAIPYFFLLICAFLKLPSLAVLTHMHLSRKPLSLPASPLLLIFLLDPLPFLSFGISDSFTISVPSLHFSRCLCLPLLSHSYLAVPGCPWNPGPIRPPRRGAGRARPARRAAAACYGATECNRLSVVASRGSRPPGPRKCSASQNSWAAPGFWLQRTRPPLLETPPYPARRRSPVSHPKDNLSIRASRPASHPTSALGDQAPKWGRRLQALLLSPFHRQPD